MTSSGIKTVQMSADQLCHFYKHLNENLDPPCLPNTYIVIEPKSGEGERPDPIGPFLWDGEQFNQVKYRTFSSDSIGVVKPVQGDPYQIAYMDSIERNQLTLATGPAGSGKTLLAIAYALQELEKGRIAVLLNVGSKE